MLNSSSGPQLNVGCVSANLAFEAYMVPGRNQQQNKHTLVDGKRFKSQKRVTISVFTCKNNAASIH